ncbi:MAG: hypothetical protein IIA72_19755 [Proteobacteria bacterium]|nr:hypothetical protein [Pseudomonadota bacterium]
MEDTDLLEMLRAAAADGRVTIGLDLRKLDDVDSPISIQAESTRWIYGLMAVAILVWWLGGAYAGIGAIAAGALIYATVARRQVERNIRRRFHDRAISDIGTWRKLWRLEGITLSLDSGSFNSGSLDSGGEACASPDGNWQRFVLDNLMTGGVEE